MINKIIDLLSKIFKKNKKYFKDFFSKVWEILFKPETMILPGQLAFFVILSLVPIISIISWIAGLLGLTVETVAELLNQIFTSINFDWIIPTISNTEFSIKHMLVLGVMFYIAAGGANSIIIASNQIYGIKQGNYITRRFKAIWMTLMLCILYIFVLIVPLLGNKIISSFNYFDLKIIIDPILAIIRGPITWVILYFFIKSIYVLAPDKDVNHKGFNLGAMFTTIFWVLLTYIYSAWINNFGSYATYYGSLSNIAVLMLWLYWLCYIFVIGMCLNVKVENEEMEKTGIVKTKE